MELRHLRYFVAVANHLSFVKAAEQLHVSQPPLSRQIREFENEIGTSLFDRGGKRIRLTKAGAFLQIEAQRILEETAGACRTARLIGEEGATRLNVGCVSFALSSVLPPLFERIRQRFPALTLELRVMPTEAQEAALRNGTIDIGFVRSWVKAEGFIYEPLFEERLSLIYPPTFAAGRGTPVSIAAFADRPFIGIVQTAAPGLSERIGDICLQSGFKPSTAYECNDAHSIVKLVAAGLGWSIVPDLGIGQAAFEGICSLALPQTLTLGISYRSEDMPPTVGSIVELAKEHFSAIAAQSLHAS